MVCSSGERNFALGFTANHFCVCTAETGIISVNVLDVLAQYLIGVALVYPLHELVPYPAGGLVADGKPSL